MRKKKSLHKIRSVSEFENGYWYASELKAFASKIGVPSSKLRKDQLEQIIRDYIKTGRVASANKKPASRKPWGDQLGIYELVEKYVSNRETKSFIVAEAKKICPNLPNKSGVWYWTNRWREQQLENNQKITYGDLVAHFVKLSTSEGRLPQIPSARYNNFISDFLNANQGSRKDAIAEWERLKALDIAKTYSAWKAHFD